MVDVFVSRPIELPREFGAGLEGFVGLLGDQGLTARTIGITDFPVSSPLDAAITLLDECEGAVILGYPQISASAGTAAGAEIGQELVLPSAWNHIEAALAYSKNLPLLIITHPGVDRGIFDRGSANSFIYEQDLSNPGWPLSRQIRGAVSTWKTAIESRPDKRDIEFGKNILQPAFDLRRSASNSAPAPELSDEQLDALIFIADNEGCDSEDIEIELGIGEQRANYHIDELIKAEVINGSYGLGPNTYYLNEKGRKILFDRDLLD